MKVYMIPIDNHICITENGDYNNSKPIASRIEKINQLHNEGNKIIYWTSRNANSDVDWTDKTLSQLNQWGCKCDGLRMNKLEYDVWVDDNAINSKDFFE